MFYRLVIQNNPDGTLSGAAAYDTPTSDARPITTDDLKTFMPDVDAAALGQKEAMETAAADAAKAAADSHTAELDKLTASHAAAIADKDAELTALNASYTLAETARQTLSESLTTVSAQRDALAAQVTKDAADYAVAVAAEGKAVHARLDALVQAAQEAHAAGDLDALGKVIDSAYVYTAPARREALEAKKARVEDELAETDKELAAL